MLLPWGGGCGVWGGGHHLFFCMESKSQSWAQMCMDNKWIKGFYIGLYIVVSLSTYIYIYKAFNVCASCFINHSPAVTLHCNFASVYSHI